MPNQNNENSLMIITIFLAVTLLGIMSQYWYSYDELKHRSSDPLSEPKEDSGPL